MNWKSFQRCSVNNSLSSAEATVIQRDWVPLSTPYFSLRLHFLSSFFSVHLSLSDTHHSALWIKCDAINQNSRGIIVCSAHFNWDCAQIVQEITSFFLLFLQAHLFWPWQKISGGQGLLQRTIYQDLETKRATEFRDYDCTYTSLFNNMKARCWCGSAMEKQCFEEGMQKVNIRYVVTSVLTVLFYTGHINKKQGWKIHYQGWYLKENAISRL